MPQDILIPAPEGSKYLSEIFNIHTSPEPTIIAVPTKALVRDKVTQEKYKRFNILGISQEFPIPEASLQGLCRICISNFLRRRSPSRILTI